MSQLSSQRYMRFLRRNVGPYCEASTLRACSVVPRYYATVPPAATPVCAAVSPRRLRLASFLFVCSLTYNTFILWKILVNQIRMSVIALTRFLCHETEVLRSIPLLSTLIVDPST
ncbi:ATP:ADP antiporter [Sesbania bispinosa]|nr:ATP:ADP antiporter [Sesbania bispinosa]